MPNLGDYVGQLLSEITLARMHADLESVRIAELYASHPLLKTFAVPRMRLPDVEVEVPVAIRSMEEPRKGQSARGGARFEDLRSKFDEVLATSLSAGGTQLTAAQRAKIDADLDAYARRSRGPAETEVDIARTADEMADLVVRAMERPDQKLAPLLKEATRREFLKLREPPPRLVALVTTAELREAGPPENLTRIRLKISEEGVEWSSIESGGVTRDRLVPE